MPMGRGRSRASLLGLMVVAIALGLGSRRFGAWLPAFVADYAGDTLWALLVYLGIAWVAPRSATWAVALGAASVSFLVEAGQLYHAPWIDAIRATAPGGLVLGYDFVASDLVCYLAGVGLGVAIDAAFARVGPAGSR
jgi:hypothetical protein